MINHLDKLLRRLLRDSGADAAVIWSLRTHPAEGMALVSCPASLLGTGVPWPLPDVGNADVAATDPDHLAALVPPVLRARLPSAPTAARSMRLGGNDIFLLLVWCGPAASGALSDESRRLIHEDLGYLAALVEDSRFNRGEVDRLRAVIDGLDTGVVSVDPGIGQASLNPRAARLLNLPPGKHSASVFAAALTALARRAVNQGAVALTQFALEADPSGEVDCLLQFAGPPTHLRVMSVVTRHGGFEGRIWQFRDESVVLEALEESERARALLRSSADAQLDPQVLFEAVHDEAGRIVDFVYRELNEATCKYLGVAEEELRGTRVLETLPNLRESGLLDRIASCAETGRPVVLDDFSYDNEILADTRRYDIRATRAGGDLVSLTWRDVTERFELVRRITDSEEQFRLLAENAADVVARMDTDGRIRWISKSVEQALGAPAEHYIGRRADELVVREDRAGLAARFRAVSRGEPVAGRARILDVDGTPHWVYLFVKPFFDAAGKPDGLVSTFHVIDAEVAAERSAQRAEARYRRLMDNSTIGMGLLTPDGRFDAVNKSMCEFFGYDADALRTKTWQELTAADFLEADLASVDEVLAGRIDSYRMSKQYIHADGHLIWGDLSVSCLRNPDGDVEYFVSQIVDITAEVTARQQIAQRDEQNRILTKRLQTQTARMSAQLRSAAAYVTSILPDGLDGAVQVSSRYLPSQELAGDCFDYRWLDDDHLIVYLLDVSGHGIEPALLSVSVHNMLRSGSIRQATLLKPDQVLAELNGLFQMDRQAGLYFTMWYGVYRPSSRTLSYAVAGHPPALAFIKTDGRPSTALLAARGMPIGMFVHGEYDCAATVMPPGSQILLYSDGAYEIPRPGGQAWSKDDFFTLCAGIAASPDWTVDDVIGHLRARTITGRFDDDVSVVHLVFD